MLTTILSLTNYCQEVFRPRLKFIGCAMPTLIFSRVGACPPCSPRAGAHDLRSYRLKCSDQTGQDNPSCERNVCMGSFMPPIQRAGPQRTTIWGYTHYLCPSTHALTKDQFRRGNKTNGLACFRESATPLQLHFAQTRRSGCRRQQSFLC